MVNKELLLDSIASSPIEWFEGKNYIQKIVKKTKRNKSIQNITQKVMKLRQLKLMNQSQAFLISFVM